MKHRAVKFLNKIEEKVEELQNTEVFFNSQEIFQEYEESLEMIRVWIDDARDILDRDDELKNMIDSVEEEG